MVRISLSILAGENKEASAPGRRFALKALEQYSEIDIPAAEFNEWVKTGTIPIMRTQGCNYLDGAIVCP